MRTIVLCMAAIWLSACSMDTMAAKILPDDVEARIQSDLEAILAKETTVFDTLHKENSKLSREEFDELVDKSLAKVADGNEIRRDIVGVQSNTSVSTGQDRKSTYSITYEIQTVEAFNLIDLGYIRVGDGPLTLQSSNVQKFDSSPVRAGLETLKKVGLALLVALLIFIVGLTTFLIRRSRRKRANP